MSEKMKSVINTSLEILEIYANALLKKAKENAEDSSEMEKNLRILNVIGCDMERLQRLQEKNWLDDYSGSHDIAQTEQESKFTLAALARRQTDLERQLKDGLSGTTVVLGACDIDEVVSVIEKRLTAHQSENENR